MIDNSNIIEIDKMEIYDIKKDFVELRESVIRDMIQSCEIVDMYIVKEYFDYMIINSGTIYQKYKNIIMSNDGRIDWIITFKNIGFEEVQTETELYKDLDVGNSKVLHIDLNDECDALLVIINSLHVKFIIREDGITTFKSLNYSIRKPDLIKEQFKLIQLMFKHYNKER